MSSWWPLSQVAFRSTVSPTRSRSEAWPCERLLRLYCMSLISHARLQLALAALLTIILAAALVTMNAALTQHAAHWYLAQGEARARRLASLCHSQRFVYCGLLGCRRARMVSLRTAGGYAVWLLTVCNLSPPVESRARNQPRRDIRGMALVSAVCFTVWYLRARRIAPPSLNRLGGSRGNFRSLNQGGFA